jgi:5,10-methylenetetrahydrofolate reductase
MEGMGALAMKDADTKPRPWIALSFEVFPPADASGESTLWASIRQLAPVGPRFVSFTYGADDSTRERTRAVVERLKTETGLTVAPHLNCVGTARAELLDWKIATYRRNSQRFQESTRLDRDDTCPV